MAFLEKAVKPWLNVLYWGSNIQNDGTLRQKSSSPGRSEPTVPTPSEPSTSSNPAPIPAGNSSFGEGTQVTNPPLVPRVPTPVQNDQGQVLPSENSGFFAHSHDFVVNRPIIGDHQQIHLSYCGTSRSPQEPLTSAQAENHRARSTSDQASPVMRENIDPREEVGKPTFIAQYQNIHILDEEEKRRQREKDEKRKQKEEYERRKERALRELRDCAIPGAEFNSAERDPPPRCHPGTRMSIRKEFQARIKNVTPGTRIIWLYGPAGVGKSAIMQTLVEEVLPYAVCASLFFSRPNQRDDPKKALATLAYGLAVSDPEYCQYIGMRVEDDPMCLRRSLDDQFRTLFITPFIDNRVKAGLPPWVMFVDGLDECQNTKESDYQRRIMHLIRDSVFHYHGSTPFIWVIASRPEENLKKSWSEIRHQFEGRVFSLWELEVPVDSDEATRDVELYLHKEFEKIRGSYSDLIPGQSRWPLDSDFLKVAKKSSGLFVFATTVVKYISDEDPVTRLEFIISLIDRVEQHPTSVDEHPFHMIDLLYSSIMATIPPRLLPIAKSIFAFYNLLESIGYGSLPQQTKLVDVCNILGLRQNEAYAVLRKLHSVVNCPSPKAAQERGIQFFHASFPDFLLDRSRSQLYHVDLDLERANVWRCYARIIKQAATTGHKGINISWLPGNDASLLGSLQQRLLRRARGGWVEILINNESHSQPATNPLADVRNVPELLGIFEYLGLAFLAPGNFPVGKFVNWLDAHAPRAIQERIVSQRFGLNQLDTECLFRSLCSTPQYQYASGRNVLKIDLAASMKHLDSSQWAQAKALLWTPSSEFYELLATHHTKHAPVMVVGMKPSEKFAITGPIGEESFYILPYFVT